MAEDRFGIVGKVIARTYEIRDVVAEGGFGVVYRAYHQGFRAEVALKCLKIPNELTDEQRRAFLEQFRAEAEVLFRLSNHSSHIVRPLHVDAFHTKEHQLVPFMALEWLEGRTLDALIIQRAERDRPPISLKKLVQLLTPVAGALEMAHNLPGKDGPQIVVHRDMKPENLFIARVGENDVAKILDFGISKVKSTAGQMAGRASVKADALVSFSPAYGAPEQWAPRRFGQTGRWTDVWGLALTVVEAAKGDEVVNGDHAAMMGTILDPVRRPTPRNEGVVVSDAVEKVFARALAVDPRHRYQSVGEFWDDLTVALGIQREVGGPVSYSSQRLRQGSGRATTGFDSLRPPSVGNIENTSEHLAHLPVPHLAPTEVRQAGSASSEFELVSPAAFHAEPQSQAARMRLESYVDSGPGVAVGGGMHVVASRPRPRPLAQHSWAPSHKPSLMKALSPALALVALSVAVTLLDRAFAHARGVPLRIGPVHASWIAAGLMIIAILSGISAVRRSWED
jgi:eukaryotic-like serine/threonine-protein kinase